MILMSVSMILIYPFVLKGFQPSAWGAVVSIDLHTKKGRISYISFLSGGGNDVLSLTSQYLFTHRGVEYETQKYLITNTLKVFMELGLYLLIIHTHQGW
jgi:hypothetical protein